MPAILALCANGAGEQCDAGAANGTASSCCTSNCTFRSASETCRASAGPCDQAENCTGSSGACPSDAKSTAVCREVAGDCDVAEACDRKGTPAIGGRLSHLGPCTDSPRASEAVVTQVTNDRISLRIVLPSTASIP